MTRLLKVEGAGNDFLLSVEPELARRLAHEPSLVRWLCDRRRGIGADGVTVVEPRGHDRVALHYWNGDGSPAAFCANGTRCAARVAHVICGLPRALVIETGWAAVPAVVRDDGQVRLSLPAVSVDGSLRLAEDRGGLTAYTVSVGVPHAVVPLPSVEILETWVPVAPDLRWDRAFGTAGCNIHLITGDGDHVVVRSWERGLMEEPLSCGSGVVAAAAVWLQQQDGAVVRARTRGGDTLVVQRLDDGGLQLDGPTGIVGWVEPWCCDEPSEG